MSDASIHTKFCKCIAELIEKQLDEDQPDLPLQLRDQEITKKYKWLIHKSFSLKKSDYAIIKKQLGPLLYMDKLPREHKIETMMKLLTTLDTESAEYVAIHIIDLQFELAKFVKQATKEGFDK